MRTRADFACFLSLTLVTAVGFILVSGSASCEPQAGPPWKIHSMVRPEAPVIDPGDARAGRAPSDAVVLFDGTDLSQWESADGGPAEWPVAHGYMESARKGDIVTKQPFGDCQLHVEWASPAKVVGGGQGRGNSGVLLMGKYEVQVLDSWNNRTYADGHAGSVYGQYPPLVNASRPPGAWQSYDIIFHGPRFNDDGSLERPARITVLHNGVLVQDNVELTGPSSWMERPAYQRHPDKAPLRLQDHHNPVRYRNIWIRELTERDTREYPWNIPPAEHAVELTDEQLDELAGRYGTEGAFVMAVTREKDGFYVQVESGRRPKHKLFAISATEFCAEKVDLRLEFKKTVDDVVDGLVFSLGTDRTQLQKIR